MKQLIIRLAAKKDTDRLVEIIKKYREFYNVAEQDVSAIKKFIIERIKKSESKIFIAVKESNILGFIQLYPSFSTVALKPQWILNDFYVLESVRNQGIGASLMNAVIEYFKDKAKGFILVTTKTNMTAKRFYEMHGWKTGIYDFYTFEYLKNSDT